LQELKVSGLLVCIPAEMTTRVPKTQNRKAAGVTPVNGTPKETENDSGQNSRNKKTAVEIYPECPPRLRSSPHRLRPICGYKQCSKLEI
jgi:hypothetical protein